MVTLQIVSYSIYDYSLTYCHDKHVYRISCKLQKLPVQQSRMEYSTSQESVK